MVRHYVEEEEHLCDRSLLHCDCIGFWWEKRLSRSYCNVNFEGLLLQ